jgi:hypothetical protein
MFGAATSSNLYGPAGSTAPGKATDRLKVSLFTVLSPSAWLAWTVITKTSATPHTTTMRPTLLIRGITTPPLELWGTLCA